MSWVHLTDLLADDKNYYGLLNLDVPCEMKITADGKRMITSKALKKLKEALKQCTTPRLFLQHCPLWNEPEWWLTSDGCLSHGDLFEIDGKVRMAYFIKLDISKWLAKQPRNRQEPIVQLACDGWPGKGMVAFGKNDLKCLPKKKRQFFLSSRARCPEAEAAFYALLKEKYAE